VALYVGIFALLVTIVAVFPIAVWIVKRRALPLMHALIFGVAFGNVPIVVGTVLGGRPGPAGFTRSHAFASLIGVSGGLAFWLISIRGRDFSRGPVADR